MSLSRRIYVFVNSLILQFKMNYFRVIKYNTIYVDTEVRDG